MAERFRTQGSNGFDEYREALVESAGAEDAGKITATGSDGKIHPSLMPDGVGNDVVTAAASENLGAGDFVNIWDDSGTPKIRLADADNGRPADGFVKEAFESAATATVYLNGVNSEVSGLTPGAYYWLSDTAGGVVASDSIPDGSGDIVQFLGKAKSATELLVRIGEPAYVA